MQPQPPNVGPNGAPASMPSSPQPTTSRQQPDPTAIAAFRAAQSANDRMTHLSGQMQTIGQLVGNLVQTQNTQNDEQFFDKLGSQLANGEIDTSTYTRKVAERSAQRAVAEATTRSMQRPQAPPPPPAPPPAAVDQQTEIQRAQRYGSQAILRGLGLQGNEPGLDFSSPQALTATAHRVLAERQPQQGTTGSTAVNVNDQLGELARQQGYVIPHRDGGRAVGSHPQATEADLDAIVWDKRNKNAPQRTRAALQNVRDSLAARVPSVRTGDGLLGNPQTFRG